MLVVILLAAGSLKFADRGWHQAARDLGVPRLAVPIVAPLEWALGVGLAFGLETWLTPLASWVAAGMLVVMTAFLLAALRTPKEKRPSCACFGRFSSKPVSLSSVWRNLAIIACAVLSALFA